MEDRCLGDPVGRDYQGLNPLKYALVWVEVEAEVLMEVQARLAYLMKTLVLAEVSEPVDTMVTARNFQSRRYMTEFLSFLGHLEYSYGPLKEASSLRARI